MIIPNIWKKTCSKPPTSVVSTMREVLTVVTLLTIQGSLPLAIPCPSTPKLRASAQQPKETLLPVARGIPVIRHLDTSSSSWVDTWARLHMGHISKKNITGHVDSKWGRALDFRGIPMLIHVVQFTYSHSDTYWLFNGVTRVFIKKNWKKGHLFSMSFQHYFSLFSHVCSMFVASPIHLNNSW